MFLISLASRAFWFFIIIILVTIITFNFVKYEDFSYALKNTFKIPLVIKNTDELKEFSKQVNEGNMYKDKLVILNNDIEFDITQENNFDLIGVKDKNRFKGIFDGKNHTISGVNINLDNGKDEVGLFTSLSSDSEVKNLKFKDSIIKTKNGKYHGALVGCLYETSKLINCYSNATLEISDIQPNEINNNIGGMVGSIERSEVRNCIYEGTINFNTVIKNDNVDVGGISGYTGELSKVLNCYNSGNININILDDKPPEIPQSDYIYSNLTVGGLVGTNSAGLKMYTYLINSYYSGKINFNFNNEEVKNTPYIKVGGITGFNQDEIENCYNIGKIEGFDNYAAIVDYVKHSTNVSKITNCYYLDTINAPETKTIIPFRDVNLIPNINITKLSEEEMKSDEFINNLNNISKEQEDVKTLAGGWKYKTKTSSWYIDKNINNGFPILKDIDYNN